jgi:hypothetical protein
MNCHHLSNLSNPRRGSPLFSLQKDPKRNYDSHYTTHPPFSHGLINPPPQVFSNVLSLFSLFPAVVSLAMVAYGPLCKPGLAQIGTSPVVTKSGKTAAATPAAPAN